MRHRLCSAGLQDEILRVTKALQLSAKHSVATPANWPHNHDSIGKKGW